MKYCLYEEPGPQTEQDYKIAFDLVVYFRL